MRKTVSKLNGELQQLKQQKKKLEGDLHSPLGRDGGTCFGRAAARRLARSHAQRAAAPRAPCASLRRVCPASWCAEELGHKNTEVDGLKLRVQRFEKRTDTHWEQKHKEACDALKRGRAKWEGERRSLIERVHKLEVLVKAHHMSTIWSTI